MFEVLNNTWLVILVPTIALLAMYGKPYLLLIFGLILVVVPHGDWQFGGVRVDPHDLILFAVIAIFSIRGRRDNIPLLRVPYIRIWFLMGCLMTAAYIYAATNQGYLDSTSRVIYQVVRYCWKPILYYPLCVMAFSERDVKLEHIIGGIIMAGNVLALRATIQGYTGQEVTGPYLGKNTLAGAMLLPFIITAVGCVFSSSKRMRQFCMVSSALHLRGFLFAGSRGAIASLVVAIGAYFFVLFQTVAGRRRLFQLAATGTLGIVLLFGLKPDLLERPNVKHLLTVLNGTADANYKWRIEQRWPHFMRLLRENPWLGTGEAVDSEEFGSRGNTPHSGYIATALEYGIPVTALIILFLVSTAWRGYKLFRSRAPSGFRIAGLTVIAVVVGLFVHNYIEATFIVPFVMRVYWCLGAMIVSARYALAAHAKQARAEAAAAVPATAPQALELMPEQGR